MPKTRGVDSGVLKKRYDNWDYFCFRHLQTFPGVNSISLANQSSFTISGEFRLTGGTIRSPPMRSNGGSPSKDEGRKKIKSQLGYIYNSTSHRIFDTTNREEIHSEQHASHIGSSYHTPSPSVLPGTNTDDRCKFRNPRVISTKEVSDERSPANITRSMVAIKKSGVEVLPKSRPNCWIKAQKPIDWETPWENQPLEDMNLSTFLAKISQLAKREGVTVSNIEMIYVYADGPVKMKVPVLRVDEWYWQKAKEKLQAKKCVVSERNQLGELEVWVEPIFGH